MATAMKLLATAGFGVAYLAVAFAAAHPRVTPEYAAHYLRRTADYWDPRRAHGSTKAEAEPPATVEVANLAYPEACHYLREGWGVTEDWGAWAEPPRAMLRLPPKAGAGAVALTLLAAPPPGPAIRARLLFSGREVKATIPAGTTRVVILPLPRDGAKIEIRSTDYAVIPSPPPDPRTGYVNPVLVRDHLIPPTTRHVGLGLIAIHYLPEGRAAPMPPHAD